MKKRIRKTGEIVDVIDFCCIELIKERDDKDWVSYIDSKGVEHHVEHGLNIYWDFEDVEEEPAKEIDWKEIDWKERRYCIAKDIMAAFLSNSNVAVHGYSAEEQASDAVLYADALIAELKKGGKDA